jgi:hypothetical protein
MPSISFKYGIQDIYALIKADLAKQGYEPATETPLSSQNGGALALHYEVRRIGDENSLALPPAKKKYGKRSKDETAEVISYRQLDGPEVRPEPSYVASTRTAELEELAGFRKQEVVAPSVSPLG